MLLKDELIERAKNVSTLDVIADTHGYEFQRIGSSYKCKQHDSLMVFSDSKGWKWYSKDIGGKSAIDWLVKIEGKTFREAVLYLTGERAEQQSYRKSEETYIEKPKELVLPEKIHRKYDEVFMYLTKSRKIAPEVVLDCFHNKTVYQDTYNNCVFVGYSTEGVPKYASRRGTRTVGDAPAFKRDCSGSDKSYGFLLKGSNPEHIFVFEAPIDALSHATLNIEKAKGMGIKDFKEVWKKHNRLALGGVSDNALLRYIVENPGLKEISFCLDNDEAGRTASAKYKKEYEARGYKVNVYSVPEGMGKDYNEYLCEFANRRDIFLAKKQQISNTESVTTTRKR